MSQEPLDRTALDRLRRIGGDRLLATMLDSFLANGPGRVTAATAAAAALDGDGVAAAAHALKSSAGNIGARRLQDTADRIEREAAALGADLRGLAETLESSWVEAAAAARALRDTLP